MYSSASSSRYSNPLVDIFLPKYCQKDLEKMVNPSQVSTAVSPNSISQHLCNHSTLLSNATVGALIRNVGPSESMIRLSFNMAAASHTWFRNEEF